MLYSELRDLTNGQCTPEEYDAINGVYMTLPEMSKAEAATLWRRLYARRHREHRAAESAQKRSIEYISTLRPGARVMIQGVGLICVKSDQTEDYNRRARRILLFFPDSSIITGAGNPVYLGWVSAGDWYICKGNQARLTKGGRLIA